MLFDSNPIHKNLHINQSKEGKSLKNKQELRKGRNLGVHDQPSSLMTKAVQISFRAAQPHDAVSLSFFLIKILKEILKTEFHEHELFKP